MTCPSRARQCCIGSQSNYLQAAEWSSPLPCRCACLLDGVGGDLCDTPYEAFCPAQCSGNGECQQGFCK